MSVPTGYERDLERLDLLQAEAKPYAIQCGAREGQESFSCRDWMRIENQKSWPSCGGHALSSLMEALYWLQTGETIQLSRFFAWVESQRVNGRPSPNNGIAIYAAVKVAKQVGLPKEELSPYHVGDFDPDFSQSVYQDAKTRVAAHSYSFKTYEEILDFHRSGMGFCIWCVPWEYRGGWHAVPSLGHFADGSLDIANSWGLSSGDDGWWKWDERKIKKYLRISGVVCFGLSDLSTPKVRPFPFDKEFFG